MIYCAFVVVADVLDVVAKNMFLLTFKLYVLLIRPIKLKQYYTEVLKIINSFFLWKWRKITFIFSQRNKHALAITRLLNNTWHFSSNNFWPPLPPPCKTWRHLKLYMCFHYVIINFFKDVLLCNALFLQMVIKISKLSLNRPFSQHTYWIILFLSMVKL